MTVTKAIEVPDEEFWRDVRRRALDRKLGLSEHVIDLLRKDLIQSKKEKL